EHRGHDTQPEPCLRRRPLRLARRRPADADAPRDRVDELRAVAGRAAARALPADDERAGPRRGRGRGRRQRRGHECRRPQRHRRRPPARGAPAHSGADAPEAGALTVIVDPLPDLKAIRNPVPVGGGADPDPPDHIRRYAPRSVLTFDRAVSGDDYETIAAQSPGVARARAYWAWSADEQRTVV